MRSKRKQWRETEKGETRGDGGVNRRTDKERNNQIFTHIDSRIEASGL